MVGHTQKCDEIYKNTTQKLRDEPRKPSPHDNTMKLMWAYA